MKLEVTENGYAVIMDKIAEIQDKINFAIFTPDAAQKALMETRGKLFELTDCLNNELLITCDVIDPNGSDAA